MQPIVLNCSLSAADDDGIAQNQQPSGAGNLTLNGVLVSGGVATLTGAGMARQVLITAAANESAKTLTIYGTNATGNSISETVTGPNATTATTTNYFRSVTRVAISGAAAGNIKVGTNGVGSSRVVQPDLHKKPFNIGIGCVVSGTVNFTLQHTFDDIGDSTGLNWFDHDDIASASATIDSNYAFPVRGVRVKINSGTGSVAATLIQAG